VFHHLVGFNGHEAVLELFGLGGLLAAVSGLGVEIAGISLHEFQLVEDRAHVQALQLLLLEVALQQVLNKLCTEVYPLQVRVGTVALALRQIPETQGEHVEVFRFRIVEKDALLHFRQKLLILRERLKQ